MSQRSGERFETKVSPEPEQTKHLGLPEFLLVVPALIHRHIGQAIHDAQNPLATSTDQMLRLNLRSLETFMWFVARENGGQAMGVVDKQIELNCIWSRLGHKESATATPLAIDKIRAYACELETTFRPVVNLCPAIG